MRKTVGAAELIEEVATNGCAASKYVRIDHWEAVHASEIFNNVCWFVGVILQAVIFGLLCKHHARTEHHVVIGPFTFNFELVKFIFGVTALNIIAVCTKKVSGNFSLWPSAGYSSCWAKAIGVSIGKTVCEACVWPVGIFVDIRIATKCCLGSSRVCIVDILYYRYLGTIDDAEALLITI